MSRNRISLWTKTTVAACALVLFSGVFQAGTVVVEEDGTVISVDVVNDPGDPSVQGIRVIEQVPGGSATTAAIPSSYDPVLDQSPAIALNPFGGVVVVWSRRQGADFELALASRPTGGDWSQHALLTYNSTSDEAPTALVDPQEVAQIVWWGHGVGGPVYLQGFSVASGQAVGPRHLPLESTTQPVRQSQTDDYWESGGLEEPGIPTLSAQRKASAEPCPSNPSAHPEHGVIRSCGRPAAYQLSACMLVVGIQNQSTGGWEQVLSNLSYANLTTISAREVAQGIADRRCDP